MSYDKTKWTSYDSSLSLEDNIRRNAVGTDDLLNKMEDGIEKANKPITGEVSIVDTEGSVTVEETEDGKHIKIEIPEYAGVDGKSAYDLAVENGYTGTEEEWVASLKGPKGDTGEAGVAGPKGDQGEVGPKGDTGEVGPQGPRGDKGDTGEQGLKGDTGEVGPQGPRGDKGDTGETGPQGETGEAGPQGPKGDKGDKGDRGESFTISKTYSSVEEMNNDFNNTDIATGAFVLIDTANVDDEDNSKMFVKGETQYDFITDLSGATGIKGERGDKGDPGEAGPKGDKGDTGETGPQGLKGDKGDTGEQGLKGDTGEVGPQGPKGDKGDTGEQGLKGDQGEVGPQGPKGDTGETGPKGDTGAEGPKGDTGEAGADGKSAYEIAVAAGYTGTEEEWMALISDSNFHVIEIDDAVATDDRIKVRYESYAGNEGGVRFDVLSKYIKNLYGNEKLKAGDLVYIKPTSIKLLPDESGSLNDFHYYEDYKWTGRLFFVVDDGLYDEHSDDIEYTFCTASRSTTKWMANVDIGVELSKTSITEKACEWMSRGLSINEADDLNYISTMDKDDKTDFGNIHFRLPYHKDIISGADAEHSLFNKHDITPSDTVIIESFNDLLVFRAIDPSMIGIPSDLLSDNVYPTLELCLLYTIPLKSDNGVIRGTALTGNHEITKETWNGFKSDVVNEYRFSKLEYINTDTGETYIAPIGAGSQYTYWFYNGQVDLDANKGPKGDKGDPGEVGPQGPKGDKGDPGDPANIAPTSVETFADLDAIEARYKVAGTIILVKDESKAYVYNGTTWVVYSDVKYIESISTKLDESAGDTSIPLVQLEDDNIGLLNINDMVITKNNRMFSYIGESEDGKSEFQRQFGDNVNIYFNSSTSIDLVKFIEGANGGNMFAFGRPWPLNVIVEEDSPIYKNAKYGDIIYGLGNDKENKEDFLLSFKCVGIYGDDGPTKKYCSFTGITSPASSVIKCGTDITGEDDYVKRGVGCFNPGSIYINTDTGEIYELYVLGSAQTASWFYAGTIRKRSIIHLANTTITAEATGLNWNILTPNDVVQVDDFIVDDTGAMYTITAVDTTSETKTFSVGTKVTSMESLKGDKGDPGEAGPKGDKGDPGEVGPQGPKGDKGDPGETGPQGPKGDKGDPADIAPTEVETFADLDAIEAKYKVAGTIILVKDESKAYVYTGTAWIVYSNIKYIESISTKIEEAYTGRYLGQGLSIQDENADLLNIDDIVITKNSGLFRVYSATDGALTFRDMSNPCNVDVWDFTYTNTVIDLAAYYDEFKPFISPYGYDDWDLSIFIKIIGNEDEEVRNNIKFGDIVKCIAETPSARYELIFRCNGYQDAKLTGRLISIVNINTDYRPIMCGTEISGTEYVENCSVETFDRGKIYVNTDTGEIYYATTLGTAGNTAWSYIGTVKKRSIIHLANTTVTAKATGLNWNILTPNDIVQVDDFVVDDTGAMYSITAVDTANETKTFSIGDKITSMESLKGDPGETGPQGPKGDTGAAGAKGDTGVGISGITITFTKDDTGAIVSATGEAILTDTSKVNIPITINTETV